MTAQSLAWTAIAISLGLFESVTPTRQVRHMAVCEPPESSDLAITRQAAARHPGTRSGRAGDVCLGGLDIIPYERRWNLPETAKDEQRRDKN